MTMSKDYPTVRERPVAKFFYKGDHTHPVRRTVMLIESKPRFIRGYELREGAEVRDFREAPIKTYTKRKIARVKDIDARRILRAKAAPEQLDQSTMTRIRLLDLIKKGA